MVKVWGIALVTTLIVMATEVPPKELVGYIQNAKRLGLSDDQIRRDATKAGWTTNMVDVVMAAKGTVQPGKESPASSPKAVVPDNYRIGPGDVLTVSVWKEPDASVPFLTVRADGKISLPLIKEVEVVGMTPADAERMLASKLGRYIHGADVTVIVTQINSRKAYMVGAVKTVGTIDLKGDTNILQAITLAGGLTDYAKRKQIYVLRTENGRQIKLPFNYDAVIKGEKIEQNITLSPNDTVVVPQ